MLECKTVYCLVSDISQNNPEISLYDINIGSENRHSESGTDEYSDGNRPRI